MSRHAHASVGMAPGETTGRGDPDRPARPSRLRPSGTDSQPIRSDKPDIGAGRVTGREGRRGGKSNGPLSRGIAAPRLDPGHPRDGRRSPVLPAQSENFVKSIGVRALKSTDKYDLYSANTPRRVGGSLRIRKTTGPGENRRETKPPAAESAESTNSRADVCTKRSHRLRNR